MRQVAQKGEFFRLFSGAEGRELTFLAFLIIARASERHRGW
jgi:hypothetical protein